MKLNFSGKHALILGGSCDLALALAEQMIQEDLFPFLTYRDESGKKRIQARLTMLGNKYKEVWFDFAEPSSFESLFDFINNDLDFLVDFAQGDLEGLVASVSRNDIYNYFSENISGRAEIIKKAGRVMLKKKRGRLVFISSLAAKRPNPGQGFYAAAKLASEALYRNIGLELGSRGVTTVSLCPGYINAGRGKQYLKANEKKIAEKEKSLKITSIKEVVETILFLLSDSARGLNATEISIDGGYL